MINKMITTPQNSIAHLVPPSPEKQKQPDSWMHKYQVTPSGIQPKGK